MTDKTKNNIQQFLLILLILFAAICAIWAVYYTSEESANKWPVIEKVTEEVQSTNEGYLEPLGATSSEPATIQSEVKGVGVPRNSYKMATTAFSQVECNTTWCEAQKGKDREYVVALNSKYGKWSKVYVPAYDREYKVIQGCPSAPNTDLDIWLGDNYEQAKEFGRKNLLVVLIK